MHLVSLGTGTPILKIALLAGHRDGVGLLAGLASKVGSAGITIPGRPRYRDVFEFVTSSIPK